MKYKNTSVRAEMDSGTYKGRFAIYNDGMEYPKLSKEDIENLELIIAGIVYRYLEVKNEKN